jgi:tetratricopeptide (TPR) repeat protein
VHLYRDWNWEAAEHGFRTALELNPGYVYGYQSFAEILASRGRLDEALVQQRRARQLDPLWVSPTSMDLGRIHELRGEDEAALAEWSRALERAPSYYATHQHLGNYHCREGSFEVALASLERARELSPDDPHVLGDLGYCRAVSGRTAGARKLLLELEERSRDRYVSPLSLAVIHLGLGERAQALEQLERAEEVHALMLAEIAVDARWDPLHSEPRFAGLLARIGLAGVTVAAR